MNPLTRRIRVMQQMETSECGLACLAMVLDYHGHSRTLTEMRSVCGSSRDGHSAFELLSAARRLGLDGRGVSTSLAGLAALKRPAILHWSFNHFVVLEDFRRGRAVIVDPASGRRRVSQQELDRSFSGVALELEPTPSLVKRRRRSVSLARYLEPLKQHRATLLFVIVANLIEQVLAVGMPAASQVLIDQVIQPAREEWLLPVMLVLVTVTFAQIVVQRLQGVSRAILHSSLCMVMTRDLGEKLLRLPLTFLGSRSHGDLLERVDQQSALQTLLADTVQALFDICFVCLLIALMLAYDPFLGAVSLGLALVRLLVLRWVRAPMAEKVAAELAARGREGGALAEATSSIEMVKGFGIGQPLLQRYDRRVQERAGWTLAAARLEVGLARAMTGLDAVMHAAILWLGGRQVIAGEMTIGVFSGFLAIRAMAMRPMTSLVSLAENWIRVRGILERCEDILSVPSAPAGGLRRLEQPCGRLELRGVGFRYGGTGPWVFRDVSFVIEPGEHVAIIGPSGHGKSTLARLLCGLLTPTEGRVLLDGHDIGRYHPEALARHFGVVLQDPLILEGTVRDALTVRWPECSTEVVRDAMRTACFDSVVDALQHGEASMLDAMGMNLSGGERQRLAIAQAVLGRPKLLLLDEATCSLDEPLERRVMDNIAKLGATVISVAHRPGAVDCAERVFVVDRGAVLEAHHERPPSSEQKEVVWQPM